MPGECAKIRDAVGAVVGPGARVWLFGSRTDDSARGGDVDLMVECAQPVASAALVGARLGARLQQLLGDRRIDIVIAGPNVAEQPIHRVGRETGVVS